MNHSPEDVHSEIGRVSRLEGALAVVSVSKTSACEGCAARGACHTLSGSGERELRAVNQVGAVPGDQVELQIPTRAGLRAAILAYLLPTLLMVFSALAAHWLASPRASARTADLVAAIAALFALALAALGAWLHHLWRGPDLGRYPRLVRKL
jgi:sigma-E factor negative regulatory protein RseC